MKYLLWTFWILFSSFIIIILFPKMGLILYAVLGFSNGLISAIVFDWAFDTD